MQQKDQRAHQLQVRVNPYKALYLKKLKRYKWQNQQNKHKTKYLAK